MIAFMPAALAIGELRLSAKNLRPVRIVILATYAQFFFVRNYPVDSPGSDSKKCQHEQRHR